jgi:hypothetical protein
MAKRKMIQYNLIQNSIAAYFAAIQIHNKPNILYRYETTTLLLFNAWELILKAFIRKYIKNRTIFENDGHTISFSKAVTYVNEYLNRQKENSFTAIKENLSLIEEYRNNIAHFYRESLDPQIFMLLARCALNYVEFVKEYFGKDITDKEGLFIMPLGFKLPFKPQDFLSKKAVSSVYSEEAQKFVEKIIRVIQDLRDQNIEESVVLGFNVYMESVKKISNSDLLVAITSQDEADANFVKVSKVQLVKDPNAQKVYLSDEEILKNYPLTYSDVFCKCKEQIPGFKKNKDFDDIIRKLKENPTLSHHRKLNPKSKKTSTTFLYSDKIIDEIKKEYNQRGAEDA